MSKLNLTEAVLAILFASAAAGVFYTLHGQHDPALFTEINDVWFQSDLKRVSDNMTDRFSRGHYRVKVHPLHSLLTYSPTLLLRKSGFAPLQAVQLVTASIAGFYLLMYYALLRAIGCLRVDALVFSLLGACSAAALFWLSVPESYGLGATSIVIGLLLTATATHRRQAVWKYIAVSAMTLSVTVTNWMVGILATITAHNLKRAAIITLVAFFLVAILWGMEKQIFPTATFFIGDREEGRYLVWPSIRRIVSVLDTVFFHTMISPTITVAGTAGHDWPLLSMQNSVPGSSGLLGIAGILLWSLLLGLGLWALLSGNTPRAIRIALGLTLLGQLSLHTLYGDETFLYSLHFLPLLTSVAALSTLTHLRIPAMVIALALIPIAGANNWQKFSEAIALAASPRHEVKMHMLSRPQDPWPRSVGHVVLAQPGSLETEKSYHEPGGNFSPGVGTFGISLWLTDATGKPKVTSETIPLSNLSQSFLWTNGTVLPTVRTSTDFYATEWSQAKWGEWLLHVTVPDHVSLSSSLLIRSVGPAGGPIRELQWNGQFLLVNGRWSIAIAPLPSAVQLGEEATPDWEQSTGEARHLVSHGGWGFARIVLSKATQWTVSVRDEQPSGAPNLYSDKTAADLWLNLPDDRFQQSLNSQIAHLMMGLVGAETRPGDPTNYPLAWQRDGAYALVALARAGKLNTARHLSKQFAEKDFFGGFGPEADAPGLSLWALGTVADQLRHKEFDEWLWPHISRKVALIETMLQTSSNLYQKVEGPIVPKHKGNPNLSLLAEPVRDGLIVGKMDHHRPVLFVNAISYRGLVEAAKLANRLRHAEHARRWMLTANKLKTAWETKFAPPLSDNDRTFISAIWPSWVATAKRRDFEILADRRWEARHDTTGAYTTPPLWTYFELAETHQWLFLNRLDRMWATLHWFWDHQSSPGLYTWWEGTGEENSFGKWTRVRGWVNPPQVTPHYWTAAEMALLQMDMLGYVDENEEEPVLILGGGIPQEWVGREMDVRKLRVGNILLDWRWNGRSMSAVIHGERRVKVKLGTSFPATADLRVTYQDT
ncbi:MAG: hypothetical protein JSR62_14965 [Nitrospira sp.]|nr:hypothetical protein [Nitrospira sp.]